MGGTQSLYERCREENIPCSCLESTPGRTSRSLMLFWLNYHELGHDQFLLYPSQFVFSLTIPLSTVYSLSKLSVRSEILTPVTKKNATFWLLMLCRSLSTFRRHVPPPIVNAEDLAAWLCNRSHNYCSWQPAPRFVLLRRVGCVGYQFWVRRM